VLARTDWDVVCTDSFRHRGTTDRISRVLAGHGSWASRVTVIQHDMGVPVMVHGSPFWLASWSPGGRLLQAGFLLAVTFKQLPIPVDAAIARAEQLLQASDGEPWSEADILRPLSVLYAYSGRFADARDAIARSRSVYDGSGAIVGRAIGAGVAGEVEPGPADLNGQVEGPGAGVTKPGSYLRA
jgi:hypothetical protein